MQGQVLKDETLTCCHGGEDRATDCRQVAGLGGRRGHFVEGVRIVDVVRTELFDDLGQKERADPVEERIPRV